jgi:lipopolysaccharide/colanic/teichoic acid biosynthesis glycosyltransferase
VYQSFGKRVLDLTLALLALPFWMVLSLIIAPAIFLEDGGPIFYNAPRLGRHGEIFTMYKFRSMKNNAPDIRNADGSTFNAEDDPRLTRIGRIIRKTSIDETPQLLNVIKGDMSIIGPRPDLPDALRIYDEKDAHKLSAKPGITGYSQAYSRNKTSLKDRFAEDIYYVENISLLLDVKILLRTIRTVLRGENVYRV